jgi:uncharacterized phage-associated protein
MLSCHDVAKYFLSLISEESGDLISNLKLQKLVYYAQGFQSALFDVPAVRRRNRSLDSWPRRPRVVR